MIVAVAIVIGLVLAVTVVGILAIGAALLIAAVVLMGIGFALIVAGLALLVNGHEIGGVFVGAGVVLLAVLALAAKASKDEG